MAPGCNLAEQALKEFDMALETLQKGDLGRRARRILVRFYGRPHVGTGSSIISPLAGFGKTAAKGP